MFDHKEQTAFFTTTPTRATGRVTAHQRLPGESDGGWQAFRVLVKAPDGLTLAKLMDVKDKSELPPLGSELPLRFGRNGWDLE